MTLERGFIGKVFVTSVAINSNTEMDLSVVAPENPKLREDLVAQITFWHNS